MGQTIELRVDAEQGNVMLRSAALGVRQEWQVVRELIGRLLSADGVESVVLDRSVGTATLHLSQQVTQPATVAEMTPAQRMSRAVQGVAATLRKADASECCVSDEYSSCTRLQFQKTENGMTAGTVVHSLPGRVRLQHPLIRQSNLAKVQAALKSVPGVTSVAISSMTGTALVLFDQSATVPTVLLTKVEEALTQLPNEADLLSGPPLSRWVASGTCLGLAIASDFMAPGVAPVTAAALVAFNLPTMARGVAELVTLNWRVASLYTVIMGTTLMTGQFLAAALMQASITCWHGWSSRRLRQIAAGLRCPSALPITLSHSQLRLLANGEHFPECLVGTVVKSGPRTLLPYDGVVVSGEADLNERSVRGTSVIARRKQGDRVFAGSFLLNGELQVRVMAVERATRASRVRETLFASIADLPGSGSPTHRSQASASRFVPFTFATGTAALMVGDLTTLAAVLRPDFATGPSMSERFGTLTSVSRLWDRGWLVRNSDQLHDLSETEAVVIFRASDDTGLEKTANGTCRRVTLATRQLEIYDVANDEESCLSLVRRLRSTNPHIAVVGPESLLSRLSNDDVIRISSTPDESLWKNSADLIALNSNPYLFEDLWHVLEEARRPHQQGWAMVVACNAIAISGAFLAGLTSLHVVVLTNIGALAAGVLYNRHLRRSTVMLAPSHSTIVEHPGNVISNIARKKRPASALIQATKTASRQEKKSSHSQRNAPDGKTWTKVRNAEGGDWTVTTQAGPQE
jgi:hypothetical protein